MHAAIIVATVVWFTVHGCSTPGAIGITANLWVESKLDPGARGSGIGVAQWVGSRRAPVLEILNDREAQYELVRTEALARGDWQAVCDQPDAASATTVWLRRYERGRGLGRRLAAARWIEGLTRAVPSR